MKHLIFTLATLFFFSSLYAQNTSKSEELQLSFEEALDLSLKNNLDIDAQRKNEAVKQQEEKAKKGLYLPTISIAASFVTMSQDITMDLNPLKGAIVPMYSTLENYGVFKGVPNPDPKTNQLMPILPNDIATNAVRDKIKEGREHIEASDWEEVIQKKNFGVANINAIYPIYTGGKIRSANKAAKIKSNEALNETEIKKSEITVELVERYFGLALAYEAKNVRSNVRDNLQSHTDNAKHLLDEGIISNAEYLHAKVYLSEAERELKKAERLIHIANSAVLNTFSMNDNKNIKPLTVFYVPKTMKPLSYYLSNITEKNQLLQKVAYKKELLHIKHKVEIGSMLPTVAAMGTLNLANKDLSHMIPHYLVGLSVKIPLFEGGAKHFELKASSYQLQQVDAVLKDVESDLQMATTKYYQEMNMYFDEIYDLETSQQFADEYYRIRQKAFTEGMATSAEVSDARLALAKVKIDKYQAMYHYNVALAKTLFYCGRINELINNIK